MAASSYYQEPAMAQAKPQFQPENTHLEGHGSSAQGLGQEMNSETRGYPQQAHNEASSGMYNGQQQPNMDQQHMATNNYDQGAPHQMNEQNSGVYGGQQQHQTGNSNYAQGADQQHMNGGAGKAAVADDRDTVTKSHRAPFPPDRPTISMATNLGSPNNVFLTLPPGLDRIEKKFGGDRFNNPENAEKNKALNANILKRLKQVGMLVMQRGPSMVMSKLG